MKKTADNAELLARVRHLERENAELRILHNAHAIMLQRLHQNGNLQIITDPNIVTKEALVPASAVNAMQMQAFDDGARYTFELLKEPQRALGRVTDSLKGLHYVAVCDNGKRTRRAAARGLGEFLSAIEDMNIAFQKLAKEKTLTMSLSPEVTHAFSAYAGELRSLTESFLVDETDAALDRLRLFIVTHDEVLAPLQNELSQIGKRGRARDKAKAFIGSRAADYPEPDRHNNPAWKIGKAIYDELRAIPAEIRGVSEEQELAFLELSDYMSADGRDVLYGRQTDLGRYIQRLRKAHLERQRLEVNVT